MTLHDFPYEELGDRLERDGLPRAHGLTLFRALHQQLDRHPEANEDLPPPLRSWLNHGAAPPLPVVAPLRETASEDGWTRKYLLRLADRSEIETVLMGFSGRFTACLSSQVGCAMGCVFCATGQMGFRRHLTAGEIVAQSHHVERIARERNRDRVRNLVLMGMGEPLHNYDAVMRALDILTDTRGLNVGPARVTLSTVGHVPGIRRLARHGKRYELAVSLHGTTDEERRALVPVNSRWPLDELLDACREYIALRRQRIFFAWTLIERVNDALDQARRLAALLAGMNAHVNLIPLNATNGYARNGPAVARLHQFQRVLREAGLPCTVRQRRGIDVGAGCGQLSAS